MRRYSGRYYRRDKGIKFKNSRCRKIAGTVADALCFANNYYYRIIRYVFFTF